MAVALVAYLHVNMCNGDRDVSYRQRFQKRAPPPELRPMPFYRVMITGPVLLRGRVFVKDDVFAALDEQSRAHGPLEVIHNGAIGVGQWAHRWCVTRDQKERIIRVPKTSAKLKLAANRIDPTVRSMITASEGVIVFSDGRSPEMTHILDECHLQRKLIEVHEYDLGSKFRCKEPPRSTRRPNEALDKRLCESVGA